MHPKIVENVSLVSSGTTVELWLPSETLLIAATMRSICEWQRFAREAMDANDPASTMGLAAQYIKSRFNAALVIHPSENDPAKKMLNSSIFAVDARESEAFATATERDKVSPLAGCVISMLKDAGFYAEVASPQAAKEAPTLYPASIRGAMQELAEMTESEAKEAEDRRWTIQQMFKPDARERIDAHGKAKRLALDVVGWPSGGNHVDYACRGAEAKPGQWIADLIARAMVTQYGWEESLWEGASARDRTQGASPAPGHERHNALAMALAAVEALPAMEQIPRFDGREPFPERFYSRKFENNAWKKPKLEGLDMLDALLSPELAGKGGYCGQGVDRDVLTRLILASLKGARLDAGRSAKLLPLILCGQPDLGFARGSANGFQAGEATAIAKAVAKADPGFDLDGIDWSSGRMSSSECKAIVMEKASQAWEALREIERLSIERAAGPAPGRATKSPRI